MNAVYLLSLVTFVAGISADRVLLAGSTDKYGIVGAISTGNESAAVTGFVSAGRAVDTIGAVTALGANFRQPYVPPTRFRPHRLCVTHHT